MFILVIKKNVENKKKSSTNKYYLTARQRVQYDKYFLSFSILQFTSRVFRRVKQYQSMRNKGNVCQISRGCREITGLSLAQK